MGDDQVEEENGAEDGEQAGLLKGWRGGGMKKKSWGRVTWLCSVGMDSLVGGGGGGRL